jgi:hypothetical protein
MPPSQARERGWLVWGRRGKGLLEILPWERKTRLLGYTVLKLQNLSHSASRCIPKQALKTRYGFALITNSGRIRGAV